jgi:hypothetical protein
MPFPRNFKYKHQILGLTAILAWLVATPRFFVLEQNETTKINDTIFPKDIGHEIFK